MNNWPALILFLVIVTLISILWGRINRIGYSRFITSIVLFGMKYSKISEEMARSYLVWLIYLFVGLTASVALLLTYHVNLLHLLALQPRYFIVIPLAFMAQSALTGLMMHVLIAVKPINVYWEIVTVEWIKYTMMMRGLMRVTAPLAAALVEEVFFRGTVFLILVNVFPQTGPYIPILLCTAIFFLQQVLQTDTLGQALIFLIGSVAISSVGCITTLYTGSFLPTLLCHGAYAVFYLQMRNWMPKSSPKGQRSKLRSVQPGF